MEFSEKLISLRKQKHLTQGEFAEEVGVTRQAVYKWESGQSYPGALTLLEMKRLFGISIDDLLDPAFDVSGVVTEKAAPVADVAPAPQVEAAPVEEAAPVAEPAAVAKEEPKKKKGFFARLFGN